MSLDQHVDLEFQKIQVSESDVKPVNLDGDGIIFENSCVDLFSGMDVKKPQDDSGVSNTAFWTFEFYQQFFNVDSNDVLLRIVKTILPWKPDFISSIKINPDLWGPFWIATTLLLTLVISSNLGDFFNWYRAFKELSQKLPPPTGSTPSPFVPNSGNLVQWTNDFSTVTVGAIVIYGYVFLLPIVLWVFMKWKSISISFIQLVSLYGYACFIMIPCVAIMTINYEIARWVMISIAFLWSIVFITVNLIWELKDNLPGGEKLLLAGICFYMIVMHALFCMFLKIYFFTFWVTYQGYK